MNRDIESQAFAASAKAKEIWETGEEFDLHAEEMFSYLQVLTACLLSFAHGANDVANAIGPIAAVISIYNTGSVSSKNPVPKWIIFLGAAGIVLGLLFYGYKLMISLGYKITKMSPSRGFCIELSASTVRRVALLSLRSLHLCNYRSTLTNNFNFYIHTGGHCGLVPWHSGVHHTVSGRRNHWSRFHGRLEERESPLHPQSPFRMGRHIPCCCHYQCRDFRLRVLRAFR